MIKDRMKRAILAVLAATFLSGVYTSAFSADSPTVKEIKFYLDQARTTEIQMKANAEANSISVDADGFVYVTDPVMQKVDVFNPKARLVKQYGAVHVPYGIAVGSDSAGSTVYVGGYNNGNTVFMLDPNGNIKGFLGLGSVTGLFNDIAVDTNGSVYLSVKDSNNIAVFNKDGRLTNVFGPYTERKNTEVINGVAYNRTMHFMENPSGIAVDGNKLYVAVKEVVRYLNNTCSSGNTLTNGVTVWNCIQDLLAYKEYTPMDANYQLWDALVERYRVLVINTETGNIIDPLIDLSGGFVFSGGIKSGNSSPRPRGLAVDKKGRLYVATVAGINVYDITNGSVVSVSGSGFAPGLYTDLSYVPDLVHGGGRLYATSNDTVKVYGIDCPLDSANNPTCVNSNTPPSAPIPASPLNKTYAGSSRPELSVSNAGDADMDQLVYGFEIYDVTGATPVLVASGSNIVEGASGKTSMQVASALNENTRYRWRAQSFDGSSSSWSFDVAQFNSTEAATVNKLFPEFCVNLQNHNPSMPEISTPLNKSPVSSSGLSLAWKPSLDPDCYDTVRYNVEISGDQDFSTSLATYKEISGTSLMLGKAAWLVKDGIYYWRIKAVDNRGGESAYGTGSFTYRASSVKFVSNQPETMIYIDGNYGYFGRLLGVTPKVAQEPMIVQNIAPGRHFVTFVKPGFEPYHMIVDIKDPVVNSDMCTVTASMIKTVKIAHSSAGKEIINSDITMASPFVVDYNNDSLKDLVVGGKDGKIYLYLSEVQEQPDLTKKVVLVFKGAVQADGADINVSSMAVPFVVDYNNDGKKDILVGSGDGLIYMFLNTGQEEAPVFTSVGVLKDKSGNSITVGGNAAPSVVDYNNDGKKDIVVGSYDGTFKVYLNTGVDEAPEFDSSSGAPVMADGNILDVGSSSKAFFTDWNSDGKLDLVVGREVPDSDGNTLNLLFNVGTEKEPSFVSIAGLRKWIAHKKKEKGNRDFIQFMGYQKDLGDLTTGAGNASPFVVDWTGSAERDIVVGNGLGKIEVYTSEE